MALLHAPVPFPEASSAIHDTVALQIAFVAAVAGASFYAVDAIEFTV